MALSFLGAVDETGDVGVLAGGDGEGLIGVGALFEFHDAVVGLVGDDL